MAFPLPTKDFFKCPIYVVQIVPTEWSNSQWPALCALYNENMYLVLYVKKMQGRFLTREGDHPVFRDEGEEGRTVGSYKGSTGKRGCL